MPIDRPIPLHVAQLLKQYGLWATKGLGQNFLDDPGLLQKIADAAAISNSDVVLEVGPGLGSLTQFLCMRAQEVVAVELDQRLTPALRSILKPYRNVRIVEGDILALSPMDLQLPQGYIVAANIPYNITSGLLRHLLSSDRRPQRIVLTVQKEVAERICASPPHMSLLALSVQVYGRPSIVGRIPAGAFFPVPKVDSAIVKIELFASPRIREDLLSACFDLIKAGFSQKRKTLRNAMSAALRLSPSDTEALVSSAGIDSRRRAETLSLAEWEALGRQYVERSDH